MSVLTRFHQLPGPLVKRLCGRRLILHAPNFPLVLLFSEKAGCTSLTKWFLFHIGKLDEATAFHPWVHRYRQAVLCRQPGYEWQSLRLLLFREKPIVKLVRNPYDRAVSSFLATLGAAQGRDSESWAGKFVAAARAQAGKPAAGALSFDDFLGYLATTGTGRDRIDKHVARQHMAGEERRIDRIIRLERFAEEIRQLESEFKLARSPLELITTSRHHRSAARPATLSTASAAHLEITSAQVRKGHVPARDSLYTAETRRLVRQCFAADFDAYGYNA
jgi:hypothetical protein